MSPLCWLWSTGYTQISYLVIVLSRKPYPMVSYFRRRSCTLICSWFGLNISGTQPGAQFPVSDCLKLFSALKSISYLTHFSGLNVSIDPFLRVCWNCSVMMASPWLVFKLWPLSLTHSSHDLSSQQCNVRIVSPWHVLKLWQPSNPWPNYVHTNSHGLQKCFSDVGGSQCVRCFLCSRIQ